MKDYSRLRPFDLEAAKPGDDFVLIKGGEDKPRKLIARPDKSDWAIFENEHGAYNFGLLAAYLTAPLAWVRASADDDTLWPVYKGDVLYYAEQGYGMAVEGYNPHVQGESGALGEIVWRSDDCKFKLGSKMWAPWDSYTFTPPKVKREG